MPLLHATAFDVIKCRRWAPAEINIIAALNIISSFTATALACFIDCTTDATREYIASPLTG